MKRLAIAILNFYIREISPQMLPRCRFYPHCSEYAVLAIEKHGTFRGAAKSIWRILRCNPFFNGGLDLP